MSPMQTHGSFMVSETAHFEWSLCDEKVSLTIGSLTPSTFSTLKVNITIKERTSHYTPLLLLHTIELVKVSLISMNIQTIRRQTLIVKSLPLSA